MGNIELREIDEKLLLKEIASEFIYETAKKYFGELEILATGPLTNIAIALIEHPDLNKHIKHIYFMGGSLTIGNVNNSAEFNIWADPEAAQVVFNSGIKTTMVGLNVSNYAYLDINDVDILRTSKLKVSDLLADIITYMINRPNQDIKVARMHDPLALAAAFYPECLEFRKYRIDAECNGFYTKGRTAIDLFHKNDSIANVSIAISLKQELFKKWLLAKFIKTAEEII